jgi:hypothetical protein
MVVCITILNDGMFLFFKIAAKIGGDAGTSLNSNDYGYGGQKRPLEDGGKLQP